MNRSETIAYIDKRYISLTQSQRQTIVRMIYSSQPSACFLSSADCVCVKYNDLSDASLNTIREYIENNLFKKLTDTNI
jgi:hypothetical protein